MARRPSYPSMNWNFNPKDAESTYIAGMILMFVLGGISLFIYWPIGVIFLLIGFLFLIILVVAVFGNQGN